MIFEAVVRSTPRTAARDTFAMIVSMPLLLPAAWHRKHVVPRRGLLTNRARCFIPAVMAILDGPRLLPKHGKPQQLVVLLHGYGADGNDLIGIGAEWQSLLPDAEFLSPHAPFPCEAMPFGRQWFAFQGRSREQVLDGVKRAAAILDQYLTEILAERGIDESKLALVGFSQGAMMSLYVGLRRAKPVAGVVAFSG